MIDKLNQRFNNILSKKVTPILKKHGFKKQGLNYISGTGSIRKVISFQKSKRYDNDRLSFTVNFGVYVYGVWSIYAPKLLEPKNPKVENCCFYCRLDNFPNSKLRTWCSLQANLESLDEVVGEVVLQDIDFIIMPFLETFNSERSIAAFLFSEDFFCLFPISKAQRYAFSAIIYFRLDEQDKALKIISEAVNCSKKTPIEDIITDLKRRLT